MGRSSVGPYRTAPTTSPTKDFVDRLLGRSLTRFQPGSHVLNTRVSALTGHSTAPPQRTIVGGYGYMDPNNMSPGTEAAANQRAASIGMQNMVPGTEAAAQQRAAAIGMQNMAPGTDMAANNRASEIHAQDLYNQQQAQDKANAGKGDPQVDGDPNVGFAGSLAPGMLNSILADPDQFLYEYLKYNGIDPTDATMSRFGNPDVAQAISALMHPNTNLNDTSDDTTASLLNYMANYEDQQATPGGVSPSADTMLKNLFRAGREGTPGDGSNNSLSELLSGGTDQQQIASYVAYAGGAINSLNPQAQTAVLSRINRWGKEWMSNKAHNMKDATTFGEYVASKGGIFGAN